MKLESLGEFGLIDRIRRSVKPGEGLRLGIGDDCAAFLPPPGQLLLTTTDMLIEGVHFRRQWTDFNRLGRKSVAVNVSDIAAMGGEPRHLYLGLAVPEDVTVEDLDRFTAGFLESAEGYGATLAGGDTCRSPGPLIISVTAEGTVSETELIRRDGARAGDALFVSGTLGDSALALHLLQKGQIPEPYLEQRHHDPEARTRLARALAASDAVSAMIDLSDGLLGDIQHILAASGVGAWIETEALPLSPPFRQAVRKDPTLSELAWSGGEDYELLLSVSPEREKRLAPIAETLGLPLTRIGTVTPRDDGLTLRDRHGRPVPISAAGFNHFGQRP
jgi:thiamine-monophosphate kinase